METLITADRLGELKRLCAQAPYGMLAEVGVYKGGSLKYLAQNFPNRHFFGFDTFQGLPEEKWQEGEPHKPGDFSDTSLESVKSYIARPNVTLVAGLFPDSAADFQALPFSFVHVDTDFYQSVRDCIEWFYPRLSEGGIMVFDDYQWPNCPGVQRALKDTGMHYQPTRAKHQAFVIKKEEK